MEILGYLCAALMGLALGMIGGGGSILTVPILVYLFGVDPVHAAAYSLFIVGLTALVGGLGHLRMGQVDQRSVFAFGLPSIFGVAFTRRFIVPALPDPLLQVGAWRIGLDPVLLLLFAVLMLLAARQMLRAAEPADGAPSDVPANGGGLALRGLLTGVATSLVGAGGGFLIVPALMAFARLPMKKAVGTSLTIIALNGLIGAASDPHMAQHPDWTLILVVAGIAIAGILVGSVLGHRVPNERLKPAFGWTLLIVGTSILLRELWGLTHGAT
ncbi:MAG: sulfite exporter TauE/SafE family protein [Bacteroidetes bacterium]|jgi:uncharacterized membrane protein YfcA|nr:sulfite exporter TauE/SafE family protein [Bacteroidota bacterium]MBX7129480.1 sulfite exporter TauE/SafE family protein [Flavobacteriales bacterium]MCC6655024.1 sulfite exporter TauE/SafE family protein [Flavobacteriales bacterium]HNA33935.1 sulfite exporter TauE/SafE family protein [Flavobacteriales bacterium]HNE80953.1 sulfite exporter TauE/SafE family protein [Flavobacteriales bacterium]